MKLVCMGDSLTEGHGVSSEERFTNLLAEKLNIEVINSGISGDTTAGMLARFNEMVIKHDPSHVLILGGTNDLYLSVPNPLIISNILAMMRYARYHNIEPIIALPTPIYKGDLEPSIIYLNPEPAAKALYKFRSDLNQFCKEEGLIGIDFYDGFESNMMLEDGLHPNAKGHAWMCTKLIKTL